ncbi:hypothetical protein Hanom_Chr06g00490721 [Helianthus anomalus]
MSQTGVMSQRINLHYNTQVYATSHQIIRRKGEVCPLSQSSVPKAEKLLTRVWV